MARFQRDRIFAYTSEVRRIAELILESPDTETGGELYGAWTHTGCPIVHYATGAGPEARREVSRFNQDISFLQESGKILNTQYGLQHLGQWHSHHQLGLKEPSSHDVKTVNKAVDHYGLDCFCLVIGNIVESESRLHGYLFEHEAAYFPVKWSILEVDSPFRLLLESNWDDAALPDETVSLPELELIDASTPPPLRNGYRRN